MCMRHISRPGCRPFLFACLILSTHAIPTAQFLAAVNYNNSPWFDPVEVHDDLTDGIYDVREPQRALCDVQHSHFRRINTYGHHSLLGACGVRTTTGVFYNEDVLEFAACALWSSIHNGAFCQASLTTPQPTGTVATLIVLLDSGLRIGSVVLADVDLSGGVPRRHTVAPQPDDALPQLIRYVDRDNICFPRGLVTCALSRGSSTSFDFEYFIRGPLITYVSLRRTTC